LSTVSTIPERFDRFDFTSRVQPPPCGFVLTALGADRWNLAGELDCASGPMLLLAADAALPRPPVLYLECRDVDFVDVAGWRALRNVRRLLEPSTELRVCHPSNGLRRLMSVLGHP
jgi:ABC-type transporter Mla MlaB component